MASSAQPPARRALRVSVTGEERLVVSALGTLLASLPGIDVVDVGSDLVVLVAEGREARARVRDVRARHSDARIVCLARSWTADEASSALGDGAVGCLLTDTSADGFSTALRQAARGEITLRPNSCVRSLRRPWRLMRRRRVHWLAGRLAAYANEIELVPYRAL